MINTIGIIVDIVIVAVIIITGILGYKKGFLRSILALFTWSVCIFIAISTAKYVANWINGIINFSSLIGKGITKNLISSNEFFAKTINSFGEANKDALLSEISNLNINAILKQFIKIVFSNSNVDMSSTQTIGSVIGISIGNICVVIITAVLIFIILKFATKLLSKLFKNLEQTKVLGLLNKILGGVFGIFRSLLTIFIINCVLVGLSLIPPINKLISPIVQDNTHIEKVIYNTTDKIIEKYVIEGNLIKNITSNIWNKR